MSIILDVLTVMKLILIQPLLPKENEIFLNVRKTSTKKCISLIASLLQTETKFMNFYHQKIRETYSSKLCYSLARSDSVHYQFQHSIPSELPP